MDSAPSARERLLATAARLFFTQGYQATGVNQIVAEAGVAKASFYQHFPSKQALALAFLDRQHHAWFSWLLRFTSQRPDAPGKIDALFDFLADWLAQTGYRGCAFINMTSEFTGTNNPLREISRRHKAGLLAYIAGLVAELPGGGGEEEKNSLAAGILVLFEGAIVEASTLAEAWPVEAARGTARRLLAGR